MIKTNKVILIVSFLSLFLLSACEEQPSTMIVENRITTSVTTINNFTNNVTSTNNITNNITQINNYTEDDVVQLTYLASREQWVNMPSAETRFDGDRFMVVYNFSALTQCAMQVTQTANAAPNARLFMKYTDGVSITTATNWSPTNLNLLQNGSNWTQVGNWEAIPAACTDGSYCTTEYWGINGNGTEDPTWLGLKLLCR